MPDQPKRAFKSKHVSQPMSAGGGSKRVVDPTTEEGKSREKLEKKPSVHVQKSSIFAMDKTSVVTDKPSKSNLATDRPSVPIKRKKPSKQKPLSKGLSPPKEQLKEAPTQTDDPDRYDKSDDPDLGVFDKTQWERSRWGAQYSQSDRKTTKQPAPGAPTTSPAEKKPSQKIAGVPGEDRQIEQVRGEHLKNRPKLQLILLAVEIVFCAVTMSVWGAAADNPMLPFILALINLLVVFSLICTVFAVEIFRFQVKKVEANEKIAGKTKHTTKFRIPYRWRFWLMACHMARAILLCACITIMALDNDFDAGSIAVLALQPFHLIIVAVQIFIGLRPKRKE